LRTGRSGDLYITVKVGDHPVFKRVGNDIHMTRGVGLTEALLGTTLEVATIDGPKVVKIPAGAKKIRLKGLGVSDMKGTRGDQYIETEVELPKKLTERQKVLVEELRKEGL
jgi:curved DNA-binding protein